MACGCQGNNVQVVYNAESTQPLVSNSSIEYVVRMPDGTYSEPLPSMEQAFQQAAVLGGQARARAKVAAPA